MDFSNLPFDVKEYGIGEYQSLEDLYLARNINREFRERFQKALTVEVGKGHNFILAFQRDDPILMGLVIEETIKQRSREIQDYEPEESVASILDQEREEILEDFVYTACTHKAAKIAKYLLSTDLDICNLSYLLICCNDSFGDNREIATIIVRKLQQDSNRERIIIEFLEEALTGDDSTNEILVEGLIELLVREDSMTVEYLRDLSHADNSLEKIYKALFKYEKIQLDHIEWLFNSNERWEGWQCFRDCIFPLFDIFVEKKILTLPLVKDLAIWFSGEYEDKLLRMLEDEEGRRLLSKISGYYSSIE